MANEQNLIPQAHELTVEEASRGGKRSAEVRRAKADLRKACQALLEAEYTVTINDVNEIKSGAEILAMAQFLRAKDGDQKSFELVRDTSGQKPVEKVVVSETDAEVLDELEKDFFDEPDEG